MNVNYINSKFKNDYFYFSPQLKDGQFSESLWDGTYMMTALAYTVSKLYWLSNPCKGHTKVFKIPNNFFYWIGIGWEIKHAMWDSEVVI